VDRTATQLHCPLVSLYQRGNPDRLRAPALAPIWDAHRMSKGAPTNLSASPLRELG